MLSGLTGIICAMETELKLYRQALQDPKEENGLVYGSIGPSRVVLGLCGPGKVNAAVCAATMLLRAKPDRILNTGVAGALSPQLHTLDTVIASSVCQHDVDTTALGDEPGLVSGVNKVYFPCDEALVSMLKACATELGLSTLTGIIASGDQFLAEANRKSDIRRLFHADCGEMESGAIGQVCFLMNTPYAALRVMSDSADGSAPMEYRELMPKAAELSSQLLLRLLKTN